MKDTGGWAFPAQHFDLADGEHGMTLRDYFAAKAMQSMNARPDYADTPADAIALDAYALADAMLAERNKP
jgi:hypothetical protein